MYRGDIKILVIGTSYTGKTNFVNKWTKNIFSDSYKATIAPDFGFKIFEDGGYLYNVKIFDLTDQIHNAKATKIFAKEAHGCVVMADATDSSTRDE